MSELPPYDFMSVDPIGLDLGGQVEAPIIDATPTAQRFRQAVSRFPTGVTVVTTVVDGQLHGMTANSFVSVSLDPLLCLVSVDCRARFHDAIVSAGIFGVTVLSSDQTDISNALARRGRALEGQFDGIPHRLGAMTGVPLVVGGQATFECRVHEVVPAGDHSLVLGAVVSVGVPEPEGEALLFYRSRYDHVGAD